MGQQQQPTSTATRVQRERQTRGCAWHYAQARCRHVNVGLARVGVPLQQDGSDDTPFSQGQMEEGFRGRTLQGTRGKNPGQRLTQRTVFPLMVCVG